MELEPLEDRTLLSITWLNRGGVADTDNFTANYGATANVARALVDRAIFDWEAVITDFNRSGGIGNDYMLTVTAMDLGGGSRGLTNGLAFDALFKPQAATVTMDDDGGGGGWFFDATPGSDSEYTTLLNPNGRFSATGAGAGNDFYRTIVHELGHAMGITGNAAAAISNFLTAAGTDQVNNANNLFLFNGASTTATMTDNGGLHVYEGPVDPLFPNNPVNDNDLMNPGRTVALGLNERQLITDLNALIVQDAYNYSVTLPSTINTFYADFNPADGVLTIQGDPGASNDDILVDMNGSLRVQVNGAEETFDGALVTSINILTGAGNDFIRVDAAVGIPTTINAGTGDDEVYTGSGLTTVASVAGDGNDLIDFSNNPAGIVFFAQGGDRVVGTQFNDAFIVDSSAGLITSPLYFDGRAGFDRVELRQTGGTTNTRHTYSVGPNPGMGTSVIQEGANFQILNFENVEPVLDLVPANELVVNATDAANAINYIEGPNSNSEGVGDVPTGLVSVDNQETIEFANKTNLVINGLAGSDEINLNNPTTPEGLVDIGIHGDDPTASDTLIVNGTPSAEDISYSPLGTDSGVVEVSGLPTISFDTVEHLIVNGQGGGANDDLIIDTFAIGGTLVLTPGASYDSGRVDFQTNPDGDFIAPSLEYLGLEDGLLIINNDEDDTDDVNFVYRGTDLSDVFTVTDPGGEAQVVLNSQITVILENVSDLTLAGLDGDDEFNVPLVNSLASILIDAGNPDSGSDMLNYTAAADAETSIDFATSQITNGAAPVAFIGVETVNLLGSDGSTDEFFVVNYGTPTHVKMLNLDTGDSDNDDSDFIEVQTTNDPDTINYTPLSGTAGRITRTEGGPQINIAQFNNDDSSLTVRNLANVGVLNVLASGAGDTIDVIRGGDRIRTTVNAFDVVRWVPVDFIGLTALNVQGDFGDDTLVVDNSNGFIDLEAGITYDGGSGEDELQLIGSNVIDTAVYTVGQNPGEGLVVHEAQEIEAAPAQNPPGDNQDGEVVQKVFFKNLEPVIDIVVATTLVINATNADNAINYIEGSNSNSAVVGNVPSGQVSVDNFETFEFANKTNLVINALAGSDEINLNNPTTPEGLTGTITVNGGDPTASDTLIVNGTANEETITYTPTGAGAGNILPGTLPLVVFDTVEHLTVNGQGGGDHLVINTNAIGGTLVLTPGSSVDAGQVDFQSNPQGDFIAPAINYLGLGNTGTLLVDNDFQQTAEIDFVYRGTDLSDNFNLYTAAPVVIAELNTQITVGLSAVRVLTLAGLNGDDDFNVAVTTFLEGIVLDGGNPDGGSDVLNYTADDDTETAIDLATSEITSDIVGDAPITFTGIEIVNLTAADASTDEFFVDNYGAPTDIQTLNLDGGDTGNDDADLITIRTTNGPDTINYTPLSSSTARITRSQGGPQINIGGFNNTDGNLMLVNPGSVGVLNVMASGASDTIDVVQVAGDRTRATVNAFNVDKWVPVDFAEFSSLKVEGNLGDDTLVVDNSGGLVTLSGGITYDGGAGFDALKLTGETQITETEYTVGPQAGSGNVKHTLVDIVQQVYFSNLEPFTDDVIAVATIINATNAANAINYVQSEVDGGLGVDGTWGKVTVDGFEANYFKNKAFVTINGLAGSDEINLNNPTTPTGLTQINIIGGDPTASDTLIVNGTNASEDITYRPDGPDSGSVEVDGLPIIVFSTVEHLTVNGQGGPDNMIIDTSEISGTLVLTPGSAFDRGHVDFQTNPTNGEIAPSLDYLALDNGGTLQVINDDGELDDVDFVYRGTDLSDAFTVDDATVNLNAQIDVILTDVSVLTMAGLDGDDTFNVPAVNAFDQINLDGGNPGASDDLNYFAEPATTTMVVFPNALIESDAGGAPDVHFIGVETINVLGTDDEVDTFHVVRYGTPTDVHTLNLDGGDTGLDDGDSINVNTTTGPDTIIYTPLSTSSARIERAQGGPQINISQFNNVDGNLVVGNAGNVDALIVEGSESSDTIDVIQAALGPRVTVNAANTIKWVPVEYATLNSLQINGNLGDDTLNINNSAGLITLAGGTTFDGGSGNDLLRLIGSTTILTSTYTVGQQAGSGHVLHATAAGAMQNVFFNSLEPVIDIVPAGMLVVNANNADNAINYIEGPNSGMAIVGGAVSGLVSVDDHETIEFTNKTALEINALAGSDRINLNNPTNPSGLTAISVLGGDPTGSDTVIVNGTTAADIISVSYGNISNPTAPTNDEARVVGAQQVPVDIDQAEHLIIDGQTGGDDLAIFPGVFNLDVISITPGPDRDSGSILANTVGGVSLLPVEYQNLAGLPVAPATLPAAQTPTTNSVSVRGADTLVYNGTAASDLFYVDTNGTITLFSTVSYLSVVPVDVVNLRVNGLAGDDTFNVYGEQPFEDLLIDGGEPSASDVLNLVGSAGNDSVLVAFFSNVLPGAVPPVAGIPVEVAVGGLGGAIGIKGIEGVNIDGVGGTNTLRVEGTSEDDTFTYTPTRVDGTADDGIFTNAGFNEVFSFNNITGTFQIDGGAFAVADEVIVKGTSGPDFIYVDSPNRTITVDDSAGVSRKPVFLGPDIEIVSVEALGGNDTILVTPAPATATGPGGAPVGTVVPINLLINVDGGGPSASDALVVAQAGGAVLPASDFVVVNRSRTPDEGVVRIYRNGTALPDITYVNTEVVSPLLPAPTDPVQDPPLLILGPDNYEQNEFLSSAAFLGSGSTINLHNLAIFPNGLEHRFVPADQDWFRVVAQKTGTLDFQAYFRVFASAGAASIPGGGNLNIEAYDNEGNLIVGFSTNDTDADARARIPAVAGQTYYVRIFGDEQDVFNGYDLTVINEAPPVPWGLELYDVIVAGDVANGVSTTVFTSTSTDLSQDNDFYNGKYIHFKSGNANGLRGLIEDYAWAAGTATFTLAAPLAVTPQELGEPPVEVIPTAGSDFEIESIDTGRSQNDNVTRDDTPIIYLRLDDGIFLHDLPGNGVDDSPPDEVIPIPFQDQTLDPGYRIAIFDEGDVPPQSSDPPQTPVGFATAVPGQEGVYFFEFTTALSPGSHFLTARVQIIDPSADEETGFGGRSLTFEIFVDVQTPPVFFGLPFLPDDGLDPGSDTGVIGMPETFTDGITSDTTPTFFGTAEADSVIRVYVDLNNNGILEPTDFLIGQTVATPIDGTNQFPGGRWQVTSNVDLNNPAYFPLDGLRTIFVTAEDPAGNEGPTEEPETLDIFLDTQGPQVTEVFITEFPDYDLFGLKPDSQFQGPTPLVFSLTVRLQDLPPRVAGFLYDAIKAVTAETPGVIQLIGDHNGIIEIDDIIVTNLPPVIGQPALATIELVFDNPLPDDRFTLILNDTIRDLAGNQLDGESDAAEPIGGPFIPPSGDGQPGGDFVARFTVDTRPEVGTYAAANIYIDANGNFLVDFQGDDNDFTNRDLNFALGIVPSLQGTVSPMNIHDGVFAGNFPVEQNNEGPALVADGFDKLAAYGFDNLIGKFRWLIDVNHDGVINPADGDHATIQPAGFQINGLPVAGNFDGNATNGDEIGLFDGTKWYFDTNHNYVIDGGDLVVNSSLRGTPIVGDFNGDGTEDLGTWRNDHFEFNFGAAGPSWNGAVQATINWGLPGVSELPVAADMDMDGITDIGLYEPARTGVLPLESGNWQFLLSNDFAEEHRGGNQVNALNHPFSPTPLGNDLFAQFGDAFALPIVGNFDPPVAPAQAPAPGSIGAVLGSATMGPETVSGEQWYEFTPLRSGTVTVDANSSAGNVNVNLYSDDYVQMQSVAPLVAGAGTSAAVDAGHTYLIRVNGTGESTTVNISNDVPLADRADTSQNGRVSPFDALSIVNELLAHGSHATPMEIGNATMYLDASLDGRITPYDLLVVVNYLLDNPPGSQFAAPAAAPAAAAPLAAPVVAPAAAEADDWQASVATALVMSGTGSGAPAAVPAIAPSAADAAYTELATATSQAATSAADAAWTQFDPIDELLEEDASDFDLEIDWKLGED